MGDRGGRPGSLIELIVKLLIESGDACMLEERLVKALVEMGKRKDSVERSIEIAIKRGRVERCIRAEGVFICLSDQKILKHREDVLSILEDIYLKLAYPTVASPMKKYKPTPEVDRDRLLTSATEHLLSSETVLRHIEALTVFSEYAGSYREGFMKACMVKARSLYPDLKDLKAIESIATRLRDAIWHAVRNRDHAYQIIEDLSKEIASIFSLLSGKQGEIAKALRDLYDYLGDALPLYVGLEVLRDEWLRYTREVILDTIKVVVEEGKLIGGCSICSKGVGEEDAWKARVQEELRRMLEAYILPPPPTIKGY
jgi:hypothetical protein